MDIKKIREQEIIFLEENTKRVLSKVPAFIKNKEVRLLGQITRAKLKPIKLLEKLYTFMDETAEFISEYSPCHKGCSSCCNMDVSISDIEVEFIEVKEGIKREKRKSPPKNNFGAPCPFLIEGACSIYKSRPYVCRKYSTLARSEFLCDISIHGVDIRYSTVHFNNVENSINYIKNKSKSYKIYDIRQMFKRNKLETNI